MSARSDRADAVDQIVDAACRSAADVRGDVTEVVTTAVERLAPLLSTDQRASAIARAVARMDGLDQLDEVLSDTSVDEVMVNDGRTVWVDRAGRLQRAGRLEAGAIDVVIERILAPLGKRLDRANPIVDARLADGSRVCAVVAPVAVAGTTLSIRRHRRHRVPLDGFACRPVVDLMLDLIERRSNVLVTGATSSGKTTLLAALIERLPADERIVILEDTSEVAVSDERHAVRLEARPSSADGPAAIDLAQLVRTALRLRPDRLVVGEFRGPEVVAVVEALNTGHDGSLSTCHANSATDGLRRVETLVMQAAPSWPLPAIRRQVSRSLDAVVHVERTASGARRIAEVLEVHESDREPSGRQLVDDTDVIAAPTRARR